MKNIVYIATLFLIIAGLSGCEKEIKDFDGEEGVYFYVQWGVDWYDTTYWAAQPYTKVEFIKKGVDEQLLKIRVQATGRIKDYDRKFRIVVDQDSTTAVKGENYLEFDEWQTIKGGWSYADVPVTVKNSEALDEVERNLVLRLLPSEDFTLAIPQWFDLSGMLGNDSGKEEFEEILKRFPELTYEDFMSNETMPSGLKYAIQNKMAMDLQALYDKSPDHRDAIREKDGRLMWFQGVSWKSYYGVPFQPGE